MRTLAQSGWPVTGQLDLSRSERRVSTASSRGVGAQQTRIGRTVVVDLDGQRVDAGAVVADEVRQSEVHRHLASRALRQVARDASTHVVGVVEAAAVERVEVELERLGLDQVRRRRRQLEARGRHARLAARVEPAQLVGVPAVGADERKRARIDADVAAPVVARDREQQRRHRSGADSRQRARGRRRGGFRPSADFTRASAKAQRLRLARGCAAS